MLQLNFLDYKLEEKLIKINRVSKTTKGGRIISFTALSIVGNYDGIIGIGYGKSKDVNTAINKSYLNGKKNLYHIKLKNNTILFPIKFKKRGIFIFLKPAKEGTGIIAGGALKYLLKLIGIKNIRSKINGSTCSHVILKIVINQLYKMNKIFNINKKYI